MEGVHARRDCRAALDMRNCPAKRLLVLDNQTCMGNDQLTAKRMQVSERRSNVPSTFADAVEDGSTEHLQIKVDPLSRGGKRSSMEQPKYLANFRAFARVMVE